MPTIVALVKHVPDTWSTKSLEDDHTLDRTSVDNIIDEINEYSVEQALRLRDENPDENYRVVALTMGPAQADEALRKALAMGADDAVLVSDDALAGADALSTAWTLNAAINTLEDVQLITLGNEASDASTGTLAGLLAEYRQLPALTELHQVELSGSTVKGSREDARGTWELEAALPAIISVTDKADKPRFPRFRASQLTSSRMKSRTCQRLATSEPTSLIQMGQWCALDSCSTMRRARACGRSIRELRT